MTMTKTEKIVGAGIGLAAIAAAGTYLLRGERGAKNREMISGWAFKMKSEILETVKNIKELNRETYFKIVDDAADRYKNAEKVGAEELRRLTQDLKDAWEHISRELSR